MKVSTERVPQSQVVLEIEVEPERLEKSLDAAYRRIVQRTNVPGFRRGKAPVPCSNARSAMTPCSRKRSTV